MIRDDEHKSLLKSEDNVVHGSVLQPNMKRMAENSKEQQFYIPQRFVVCFLCFLGIFTGYSQRVNLSVAVITMADDYDWTDSIKGLILSSFFWGYVTTQFPGGWIATKYGGKRVLAVSLLGSSLFTLLLPFVADYLPALIACRVLTGICEGALYPTIHNILSCWLPAHERSRFIGFVWGGSYVGTIITTAVSSPLVNRFGWPIVFYVFGGIGFVWLALWIIFSASSPDEHRWITEQEKELIASGSEAPTSYGSINLPADDKVPLKKILTSSALWAICSGHFAMNWGFYILLTWLPTYLNDELNFSLEDSGVVAFLPYIAMFLVAIVTGRLADYLITRKVNKTLVRKCFQFFGLTIPAVCLSAQCTNPTVPVAVALMVCGLGGSAMTCGGYGANPMDIAPRFAGIIFGFTNTIGTIPGIGSWCVVFLMTASVEILGMIGYVAFADTRLLFP